jgi:hypothetical protein
VFQFPQVSIFRVTQVPYAVPESVSEPLPSVAFRPTVNTRLAEKAAAGDASAWLVQALASTGSPVVSSACPNGFAIFPFPQWNNRTQCVLASIAPNVHSSTSS